MIARQHDTDAPSLGLVLVDALVFWLRHQGVFWLMALPIAGLAAAITYVLEANQALVDWRHHWGWGFLFAFIYAMFLDRWIKESLLDDATPCEGVDALRHALVPAPFLMFAIVFFLFAMGLSWLQLQGIEQAMAGWGLPRSMVVALATLLAWLPHLLVWATALAFVVLMVPAWCAGAPLSLGKAWRLSEPVRPKLFRLIVGAVLLSMAVFSATLWGLEVLPKKSWAPAAMAGAQRLADCLLLAIVGHVLASLFRTLADWQQPEPEERPFRNMRLRPRGTAR